MYQHSLVISNLYSTYMGHCHEYHTEDVFSELINFGAINANLRVQNRRSLLAKCECERLRSSTQVSALARNIECQKAKRHRGCLHYDLFIAQL